MINLLTDGHYGLFASIFVAIAISLSFHEFGHAYTAKLFGDNTAEKMGRVSLNPLVHLDPMGTIMLILIGFGYAKPVPTDPRNFNSKWADFFISSAGPGMNFVLAFIAINLFVWGQQNQISLFASKEFGVFVLYFSSINLLLMLFNLIPIGSLDGHYILPYFLPDRLKQTYIHYNSLYGDKFFLVLIFASILGVPIFENLSKLAQSILPFLVFV